MQRDTLRASQLPGSIQRLASGAENGFVAQNLETHQKFENILGKVLAARLLDAEELDMLRDSVKLSLEDSRFVRYRYIKMQSVKETTLWKIACEYLGKSEEARAEDVIPHIQGILNLAGKDMEQSLGKLVSRTVEDTFAKKIAELGSAQNLFVMTDDIATTKSQFYSDLQMAIQKELAHLTKNNIDEIYKHVDSRKSQGFTRIGDVQLPKYQQFLNLQDQSETRIVDALDHLKSRLTPLNKKKICDFLLLEKPDSAEGGARLSLTVSPDPHARNSNELFARKSHSTGSDSGPQNMAPVSLFEFESELINGRNNIKMLNTFVDDISKRPPGTDEKEGMSVRISAKILELADIFEQSLVADFIHKMRTQTTPPLVATSPNNFFREQFDRFFRDLGKQVKVAGLKVENLNQELNKVAQNFTIFWDAVAQTLGVPPQENLVEHLKARLDHDKHQLENLTVNFQTVLGRLAETMNISESEIGPELILKRAADLQSANVQMNRQLSSLDQKLNGSQRSNPGSFDFAESLTKLEGLKQASSQNQNLKALTGTLTHDYMNFIQEIHLAAEEEIPDLSPESLEGWNWKPIVKKIEDGFATLKKKEGQLETLKNSTSAVMAILGETGSGQTGPIEPTKLVVQVKEMQQERKELRVEMESFVGQIDYILGVKSDSKKLQENPAGFTKKCLESIVTTKRQLEQERQNVDDMVQLMSQTYQHPFKETDLASISQQIVETKTKCDSLSQEKETFSAQACQILEIPAAELEQTTDLLGHLQELKAHQKLLGAVSSHLKIRDFIIKNDVEAINKELKRLTTSATFLQIIQDNITQLSASSLEGLNVEVRKAKMKVYFSDLISTLLANELKTLPNFANSKEMETCAEKIKEAFMFSKLVLEDFGNVVQGSPSQPDKQRENFARLRDDFLKLIQQNWPNEVTGQVSQNYNRFFQTLGRYFQLQKLEAGIRAEFPGMPTTATQDTEFAPEIFLKEVKRASVMNEKFSSLIQKSLGAPADSSDADPQSSLKQFKGKVKELAFLQKELKSSFPEIDLSDQVSCALFLKNLSVASGFFKKMESEFPDWFGISPTYSVNENAFFRDIKIALLSAKAFEKLSTKLLKRVFEKSPEFVDESLTALDASIDGFKRMKGAISESFGVDEIEKSALKTHTKNLDVATRVFDCVKKVFPQHLNDDKGALEVDIIGLEGALRKKNEFLETVVQGLSGVIPELNHFSMENPDRLVELIREALLICHELRKHFLMGHKPASIFSHETAAEFFKKLESLILQAKATNSVVNEVRPPLMSSGHVQQLVDGFKTILVSILELSNENYPPALKFSMKDSGKIDSVAKTLIENALLGIELGQMAQSQVTSPLGLKIAHPSQILKLVEPCLATTVEVSGLLPEHFAVESGEVRVDLPKLGERIRNLKSLAFKLENDFAVKSRSETAETKLAELQSAQEFKEFFVQRTKGVYKASLEGKRKEETLLELLADHEFVTQIRAKIEPDFPAADPHSEAQKASVLKSLDFFLAINKELEVAGLPLSTLTLGTLSLKLKEILGNSLQFQKLGQKVGPLANDAQGGQLVDKCAECVRFWAEESGFVSQLKNLNQKGLTDEKFREKVLESVQSAPATKKRATLLKNVLRLDLVSGNDSDFERELQILAAQSKFVTDFKSALGDVLPQFSLAKSAEVLAKLKVAMEAKKVLEDEFSQYGYEPENLVSNLADFIAQAELNRNLFLRLAPDDEMVGTLEENEKRVMDIIEEFADLDKLRAFATGSMMIPDSQEWADLFLKKIAETMDHLEFKKKSASLLESKYEEINNKYTQALTEAAKPPPAPPGKAPVRGKAPAKAPVAAKGKQPAKPAEPTPEEKMLELKQKSLELEKQIERMKIAYELLGIDYMEGGLEEKLRLKIVELKSAKESLLPSVRVSAFNENELSKSGVKMGSRETLKVPSGSYRFSARNMMARGTIGRAIGRGSVDTNRRMFDSVGDFRGDELQASSKNDFLTSSSPVSLLDQRDANTSKVESAPLHTRLNESEQI